MLLRRQQITIVCVTSGGCFVGCGHVSAVTHHSVKKTTVLMHRGDPFSTKMEHFMCRTVGCGGDRVS